MDPPPGHTRFGVAGFLRGVAGYNAGVFDALIGEARTALASAQPAQVADATRAHLAQTPPDELAGHLTQAVPAMDAGTAGALAKAVLDALAQHGEPPQQVANAGVQTQAATQGRQDDVVALIEHAAQNPEALRAAAVRFAEQ